MLKKFLAVALSAALLGSGALPAGVSPGSEGDVGGFIVSAESQWYSGTIYNSTSRSGFDYVVQVTVGNVGSDNTLLLNAGGQTSEFTATDESPLTLSADKDFLLHSYFYDDEEERYVQYPLYNEEDAENSWFTRSVENDTYTYTLNKDLSDAPIIVLPTWAPLYGEKGQSIKPFDENTPEFTVWYSQQINDTMMNGKSKNGFNANEGENIQTDSLFVACKEKLDFYSVEEDGELAYAPHAFNYKFNDEEGCHEYWIGDTGSDKSYVVKPHTLAFTAYVMNDYPPDPEDEELYPFGINARWYTAVEEGTYYDSYEGVDHSIESNPLDHKFHIYSHVELYALADGVGMKHRYLEDIGLHDYYLEADEENDGQTVVVYICDLKYFSAYVVNMTGRCDKDYFDKDFDYAVSDITLDGENFLDPYNGDPGNRIFATPEEPLTIYTKSDDLILTGASYDDDGNVKCDNIGWAFEYDREKGAYVQKEDLRYVKMLIILANETERFDGTITAGEDAPEFTVEYTVNGDSLIMYSDNELENLGATSVIIASDSKLDFYDGENMVNGKFAMRFNENLNKYIYAMNDNSPCDITVRKHVTSFTAKVTNNGFDDPDAFSVDHMPVENGATLELAEISALHIYTLDPITVDAGELTVKHSESGGWHTYLIDEESGVEDGAVYQITVSPLEGDSWLVEFDADGGTGEMNAVRCGDNDNFVLPECGFTVPEGMRFKQWDAGLPGDIIKVTDDMTVKAVWEENPVNPGDVNGDGDVNMLDYALMQRYLANWEVEINRDNADLNGDGDVNMQDYALMQRLLAGWEI